MKAWRWVGIGAIVALCGCAFLNTKPTTEEQKITLKLIRQRGEIGCTLAKEEWPEDMIAVQTILRDVVLPQLNQSIEVALRDEARVANSTAPAEVMVLSADQGKSMGAGGSLETFNWPIYITPVLSLAKLFAIQMGVLDTSATYYEAVREAVVGCLAGLE